MNPSRGLAQAEAKHHAHDSRGGHDLPGIGADVVVGCLPGEPGLRTGNFLQFRDSNAGRFQRFLCPRADLRDPLPGPAGSRLTELRNVGGEYFEIGHQLVGTDPITFGISSHTCRLHVH